MKSSIFWDITPCGPFKVNRSFGGTCRLHLQGLRISQERNQRESGLCLPPAFTLVSCLAYSSTLETEETCSSKMSVDFQRATRRYVPQNLSRLRLSLRMKPQSAALVTKHETSVSSAKWNQGKQMTHVPSAIYTGIAFLVTTKFITCPH
jgi:hypothetical protein